MTKLGTCIFVPDCRWIPSSSIYTRSIVLNPNHAQMAPESCLYRLVLLNPTLPAEVKMLGLVLIMKGTVIRWSGEGKVVEAMVDGKWAVVKADVMVEKKADKQEEKSK